MEVKCAEEEETLYPNLATQQNKYLIGDIFIEIQSTKKLVSYMVNFRKRIKLLPSCLKMNAGKGYL